MITYIDGNLFESPAKVLVNTVNTKGVMGKGIALRFKRIYPPMFEIYQDYCEQGRLEIGRLFLYKTRHKWILNFPTKKHWRNPSRIEYIEAGLRTFTASYAEMRITTIAFPALGCGNGELDYEAQVKPLMEKYLGKLSIPTLIYLAKQRIGPPEHRDAKNISDWLRSEPSALPFEEVWQDIVRILHRRTEFKTRARSNSYTAHATEDPPTITIKASGKTSRIIADELLEFWQQLRDYGLTHSSIAPGSRCFSYLMPVFEELPYVRAVTVSNSTERLKTNPAVGLQVIPPPLPPRRKTGDLFTNLLDGAQAGR